MAREHRDIAVEARRVTPLFAKLDSVIEDRGHVIIEEGATDPDAIGVTFSGGTSNENAYYVD